MNSDKLISFIQSTFKQTAKSNAVIALSGGIDSATSLFLTVKALGPENVFAFHFPAKSSNPRSLIDAQAAAKAAGLPDSHIQVIPIKGIIQKTWRILKNNSKDIQGLQSARAQRFPKIHWESSTQDCKPEWIENNSKLRLANIAARIRMILIFDMAKKFDALVVGTENLSEHLLGYYTRFGDEGSDIEPLRKLFKTDVFALAKELGVPKNIITKPPSADLWKGQSDEGELGFTYAQADPILKLIQAQKPLPDNKLAKSIKSLIEKNLFKQQVPYVLDE